MIRMVLLGLAFLAITVALIVIQPGAASRRADQPVNLEPVVTRAEPAMQVVAPEPTVPSAVLGQPAVPVAPVQTTAPRLTTQSDLDDQSLRKMTWDTLSSLNHATGRETAPGQPGSLLHTIVKRSLNEAPGQAGSAAPSGVYIVQPGDSLVSIADAIYGDVNMTGPLFAANQAILSRPDDLKPGQALVLPNR
ncbi:MAG: LysM peptidoglycan-binding domain-containing protein [Pelagimonas sp.]|jgi:nucleoid-associated protein YgaU|nr:LysM peptidoglycan-binding domain-containing protein [Pelagimonas sp.]